MFLEPQRKIENHKFDWIFHLGIGLAVILTVINIIVRVKKIKNKDNLWLLDVIAIISTFLMLLYHYLYRWQLEVVLIFLILFICNAIYHGLKILNIKDII